MPYKNYVFGKFNFFIENLDERTTVDEYVNIVIISFNILFKCQSPLNNGYLSASSV